MANSQEVTVSYTARAMAAVRACESKRDDALFVDPFAQKLAGDEVVEKAITLTESYEKQGRPYSQVRTRFLDEA
ncbi:class I SAM-dependent methyltransferase [Coleofasciculus sp.]|uniref:class I SAM-dependent methyltransferase n=1 Tax=Coleofasciculus sp. TaxID=3100458 RepID=UPI0039F96DFE